ncbi:MAG: MBL fold metallo-hydrolase [Methanospirillum sp.]|uniref:MBL fold metallo-hydrolase n=1 Tax=Methanospirillum sp. TaxID=45200 RepID=UPI002370D918|nr:MBL fold metallo-hydrolase [Methanospirillum sp.]MDD1729105.1 MBL fold metallo-hydrolase [Methanospirillum sp.]
MQIHNLTSQSTEYTSNVYHITGEYLQLSDQSTLIDVGRDIRVIGELRTIRTGIGKKPVDQIFLTHSHFDHAGLLKEILERYPVPVYAHPQSRIPGIHPLQDQQIVHIGDNECEVIWGGTHSEDSVCYFCQEKGILFSGDVPMRIYTNDGIYDPAFLLTFERISSYEVKEIYPGHGDPIVDGVRHMLDESYRNLKGSKFF